jgi:hypothetical protein
LLFLDQPRAAPVLQDEASLPDFQQAAPLHPLAAAILGGLEDDGDAAQLDIAVDIASSGNGSAAAPAASATTAPSKSKFARLKNFFEKK